MRREELFKGVFESACMYDIEYLFNTIEYEFYILFDWFWLWYVQARRDSIIQHCVSSLTLQSVYLMVH